LVEKAYEKKAFTFDTIRRLENNNNNMNTVETDCCAVDEMRLAHLRSCGSLSYCDIKTLEIENQKFPAKS
jgi:hypothetical protein